MSTEASEPISGVDIAWLRMDTPTNLMIINSMLIIDKVDFESFKTAIRNRFLAFSRFSKRPVCNAGQYFWERDPYFDLDNHYKYYFKYYCYLIVQPYFYFHKKHIECVKAE